MVEIAVGGEERRTSCRGDCDRRFGAWQRRLASVGPAVWRMEPAVAENGTGDLANGTGGCREWDRMFVEWDRRLVRMGPAEYRIEQAAADKGDCVLLIAIGRWR